MKATDFSGRFYSGHNVLYGSRGQVSFINNATERRRWHEYRRRLKNRGRRG